MEVISGTGTNSTKEVASDSLSSDGFITPNKRKKQQLNGSGGNSSSKFKGVVLQQNGHWGAQIYANHNRIWLGTFRSEKEAGMAYDSAAILLRSGDSHRNFPSTYTNTEEPKFQRQFTTDTVLAMIKDGTYQSKFVEYLRSKFKSKTAAAAGEFESVSTTPKYDENENFSWKKLFHKILTPSDVGKLNRLVIPKKFALMYFPPISEPVEENEVVVVGGVSVDDTEIVFFDKELKSWKFRYCYWKSSQSFVFTRGWNRFVKDKRLRAKDTIIFSIYECRNGSNEMQSYMIHVEYSSEVQNFPMEDKEDTQDTESNDSTKHKHSIRLFGVQIP